jgi:hypothetical protein
MAVLYLVGFVLPIGTATFVVLGLITGAAVLAVTLRRRGAAATGLAAALRPDRADVVTWATGLALMGLLLTPTFRLGYPTTIARSNNDGWSYAGFVDWLSQHSLADRRAPSLAEPLNNVAYFQLKDGFGCGFEMLATLARTLTAREPFEVVGIVSALGAVVAACGWVMLWRALTGRLGAGGAAIGAVCAMSPALVLAYSENYTPHYFALCLWPYAIATVARFLDRPTRGSLASSVLGVLAVLGTYPALIPWLAMGVAGLVAAALLRGRIRREDALPAGRVAVAVGALIAGCLVAGPFQARQTWIFATVHDANSGFATYPEYTDIGYASFGLGTATHFAQVVGGTIAWNATLITLAVVVAIAAGVGVAVASRSLGRTVLVMGGVLVAFVVVFGRFASLEAQAYGMFKATLTSGTLFTGLAMILLGGLAGTRIGRWGLLAVAGWATVWFGVSVENIEQSYRGGSGFRPAEVELGRELDRLPRGTTVLAGGGAEEVGSFQLRMMSAYFGTVGDDDLEMEGLGTTSSYVAGGGTPDAVPDRPWRYVIESAVVPTPMSARGRLVWQNAGYRLEEAGATDVTRYGSAWQASEQDASGGFAWVTGPVQFVISNRTEGARTVRLRMRLQGLASPMAVTFRGGRAEVRTVAPATGTAATVVPVDVPANGTTVVTMTVPERNPAAPADPRRVRVQAISAR